MNEGKQHDVKKKLFIRWDRDWDGDRDRDWDFWSKSGMGTRTGKFIMSGL